VGPLLFALITHGNTKDVRDKNNVRAVNVFLNRALYK